MGARSSIPSPVRQLLRALLTVAALGAGSAAQATDGGAQGVRDPFAAPHAATPVLAPSATAGAATPGRAYATSAPSTGLAALAGSGGANAAAAGNRADGEWAPRLRGVMVDGSHSLANVEGVLLAVGQSVDGHRLVAVREDAAEFAFEGHTIVLRLPDHEESRPR